MTSVSATAIGAPYAEAAAGLQLAGKTRTAALERVILCLLSAFAFVMPTDLRLPGYKSIAMRLGYTCLLLGIAGLIKRRAFVLPRIAFWCLFGFVAWSCCSLTWARYPEAALHKVLLYIVLFTVTVMIPQY